MSKKKTNEEMIIILKKKIVELGHIPTMLEADCENLSPRSAVFVKRFGSWNKAIEATGITFPDDDKNCWDKKSITDGLVRLTKYDEHVPSKKEINKCNYLPSYAIVIEVFGSIEAAFIAAGIKRRPCTKSEVTTALISYFEETGQVPTIVDARCNKALPSYAITVKLFGGWNKAIEAAGLPVNKPGYPIRYYPKNAKKG